MILDGVKVLPQRVSRRLEDGGRFPVGHLRLGQPALLVTAAVAELALLAILLGLMNNNNVV